ncbi:MAG: hypothetical protein HOP29_20185 [Phycisphaerales bacterium]|nr:hypothetical protein [Phycisphaerales bacterium]
MGRAARSSAIILAAVVLTPAVFAAPPFLVSDVEPNDTVSAAASTGLLDSGGVIIHGLNSDITACCSIIDRGRDPDIFSVTVTPQATYPIMLTARVVSSHPELEAALHVFARCPSNPTLAVHLAWRDEPDPPHSQPVLNTYLLEPGTYYVGISSTGPFGIDPNENLFSNHQVLPAGLAYQLEIELASPPPIDSSLEPNDTVPVPVDSLPFTVTDQFIGDGPSQWLDIDRYGVNLAAPGIVSVRAEPAAFGELNLVAFVNIGTATFETVHEPRPDLRTQSIRLAVFQPGLVEVIVNSVDMTLTEICTPQSTSIFVPGHDVTGYTGFYHLAIDVEPFTNPGGPLEPNDSVLQSTPTGLAAPGTAGFDASVGDGQFGQLRGDVDFYRFDLALDERLECDVLPTGGPDALLPVAHLYDDFGRRLRTFYPDDDGLIRGEFQRTCRDALVPPAAAREKYHLAVLGAGDRPPADALVPNPSPGSAATPLALHHLDGGPGSTGSYHLDIAIASDPLPRCGTEPDDSVHQAPLVLVDDGHYVCVRGAIGDGSCPDLGADVDLVAIRLDSAPAALDLRLNSTLCGSSEDKLVRLFDADGNELAVANVPPIGTLPPRLVDSTLRVILDETGDYFIGVSDPQNTAYDPLAACSGSGTVSACCESARYELDIHLSQTGSVSPPAPAGAVGPIGEPTRLFAVTSDPLADPIIELNPDTGDIIQSHALPDARTLGGRGLAFDGVDLFLLDGSGRFPLLQRISAETGEIMERTSTWFGSGLYGGMVAIGQRLYITDLLQHAIYELSDGLTGPVSRLDVGTTNLISMFGPVAAAVQPDRLIVSDASDPGTLHTLDAATGRRLTSAALGTDCPCDADLDRDGDIDAADAGLIFDCAVGHSGAIPFGCRAADLNCDATIDPLDENIFNCLAANQPGESHAAGEFDCCPAGLPSTGIRATALAGAGPNLLYTADWAVPVLRRYRGARSELGEVALSSPVMHLAGLPSLDLGDWDADGLVNLIDWGRFQACYRGDNALNLDLVCEVFDFDIDGRVDLLDFNALDAMIVGTEP